MELRDSIVQKSYELLYRQGFHVSGVELLARHAGTTKRTLYAHFGSKEGLIEEVLKYRHQVFMTQLIDYLDGFEIKEAADVARYYLAFLKDWTSSEGFYGCMFINACAEFSDTQLSPHQIASQHKSEVRQWLLNNFEEVGAKNARQKSDTLFVLGEGIIVAAQTGQKFPNLDIETLIGIISL